MPGAGEHAPRGDEGARAHVDGRGVQERAVVVHEREAVKVDVEAVVAAKRRLDRGARVPRAEELAQDLRARIRVRGVELVEAPAEALRARLKVVGHVEVAHGVGRVGAHEVERCHGGPFFSACPARSFYCSGQAA